MKRKVVKILIAIILIAQVGFLATPRADAFFPDWLNAGLQAIGHAITKVQTALHMNIDLAGHGGTITSVNVGTGVNATGIALHEAAQVVDPAGAANKATVLAVEGSDTPCVGIEKAEQIASQADTALINSFALITGSAGRVVKVQARIAALTAVQTCREFQLRTLSASIPQTAITTNGVLVGKKQELTAQIDALKARIERLKELADADAKDFLRAILTKIALNLQKTVTTKVVNGLVNHYKISNYLHYADAVANQVYVADFINKNYKGDAATALMVKSLATNNLAAPTLAKLNADFASNKAVQYAGLPCISGLITDPTINYNTAMVRCGSTEANPLYQAMILNQQGATAQSTAQAAAAKEVADSKGFIPQRTCAGSLQVEAQTQSRFQQAVKQAKLDYDALVIAEQQYQTVLHTNTDPTKAYTVPDAAAVAQAKAVRDQASAKSQASQDALQKFPSEKPDAPLATLCQAISSPGGFIADTISNQIQAHLNEQATLNSDNLPGALSRIADIASNLIAGLITGGSPGSLLKEAGLQSVGVGTQTVMQGISESFNGASSNASGGLHGTGPVDDPCTGTCGGGTGGGSTSAYSGARGSVAGAYTQAPLQLRGPASPTFR